MFNLVLVYVIIDFELKGASIMPIKYQTDDLFFDLETRKDFFVLSQYYPKQDKLIVSFLEQLHLPTHLTTNSSQYDQAASTSTAVAIDEKLNQEEDENLRDALADGAIETPLVSSATGSASSSSSNSTDDKDQFGIDDGYLQRFTYYPQDLKKSSVVTKPEIEDKIRQLIRQTVTHYGRTTIEFENLAIYDDFIQFAKRYGYVPGSVNLDQIKQRYNLTGSQINSKRPEYDLNYLHNWNQSFPVAFDTDPNYDDQHNAGLPGFGIRVGYNSQNYDQTVVAYYLGKVMADVLETRAKEDHHEPVSLSSKQIFANKTYTKTAIESKGDSDNSTITLNNLNTNLFDLVNDGGYMNNALRSSDAARSTYNAWKMSNRFVDVSNLNPKRISLKRCAMALGLKIEESNSNRNPTAPLGNLHDIIEVIGYNANDVYVTMKVFDSKTYTNRYLQNKQLLKEFPYLIYQQTKAAKNGKSKSKLQYDAGPFNVRYDRFTVNSTSAKFVEHVIAPYTNTKIKDNPTLNLIYPGPDIIAERKKAGTLPPLFHGKPRNMLDYISDLMEERLKSVDEHTANQVRHQFKRIRDYYSAFIGQNFNNEMDPDDPASNFTEEEKQLYHESKLHNFEGEDPNYVKAVAKAKEWLIDTLTSLSDHQLTKLFGPKHASSSDMNRELVESHLDYLIQLMKPDQDFSAVRKMKLHVKYQDENNESHTVTMDDLITEDSGRKQDGKMVTFKQHFAVASPYRPFSKANRPGLIVPYITPNGTYKDPHGTQLRSYAVISVGGAHGLEAQYAPYHRDMQNYQDKINLIQQTIDWINNLSDEEYQEHFLKNRPAKFKPDQFTNALDQTWPKRISANLDNLAQFIAHLDLADPYSHIKRRPLPFNEQYTFGDILPKSGSRKKPKLRTFKKPSLFDGSQIADIYSYTSSNASNHEDFDSYYPSLISNLEIFKNADGKDVFTQDLYHPRLHLKKIAKGKITKKPDGTPYSEEEIQSASLRQLSMKLLINSASGAGAANFGTNVRCNNKMIAMRIIGQLFCWYIGQSLSLAGARVPSTNTDGLYTMNIDKQTNDRIVDDCAAQLLLNIGPEFLPLFVSKDANSRLETNKKNIFSARGGALTSWQGPSTDNSIAHPAIVDYILAQYLARVDDAVNKPFDPVAAKNFFKEFLLDQGPDINGLSHADVLRYFQFPLVANAKTARFDIKAYANPDYDPNKPLAPDNMSLKVEMLNPTNRIFLAHAKSAKHPLGSTYSIRRTGLIVVQNGTVNKILKAKHLSKTDVSFSQLIDMTSENARIAQNVIEQNVTDNQFDKLMNGIYNPKATKVEDKPRTMTLIKIPDLPENQPVLLINEDLHDIDDQTYHQIIFKQLDMNAYLKIVQDKFEKQWHNVIA